MKMTRSNHITLHNHMRGLGLKVSHINTGHENIDELGTMKFIDRLGAQPKGL